MRIVLEPGSYSLENVGDVAMLQVAARRLKMLLPEATLGVVTEAPRQLASVCPDADAILTSPGMFRGNHQGTSQGPAGLLSQSVWQLLPGGNWLPRRVPDFEDFAATIRQADVLVGSGMGTLNDFFAVRASRLLTALQLAEQYDVPAALFSQGIGPIQDDAFRKKVARGLSGVELIALRERRTGPALLEQLGATRPVTRVTGDDAIELAYESRPEKIGTCLGVNVRVADYAGVDKRVCDALRPVLRDVVATLKADVLPVPISHRHNGLDARTNRALLAEINPDSDGGAALVSPRDVIREVGRCRVVVAGSYHAGVFALAQGIPVVALVNSQYYEDKFLGLAGMFTTGCEVVYLGSPGLAERLRETIERSWATAPEMRAGLLAAAAEQVQLGNDAYRDLFMLIGISAGGVQPRLRGNRRTAE
jgi:polysaccharide pyruvyl transferase WcaK-like protein